MKKLYYAYILEAMISYFEKKISELEGKIKVLYSESVISENGESVVYYVLEAEEGVINSKWELN